jgi:hypothetical protein
VNPEQYAAQQAIISAAVARYVLTFARFFTRPALAFTEWVNLLTILFPEIQRQREESAALAREFYDSQRDLYHPQLPRNDRPLEGTEFRVFVENMEPARKRMSLEDSPKDAVTSLALRAVREVENAGRQQIIHAVANDPEDKIIRGWTRVATGRETCAWCLMLISRGPTYSSAATAGLDLDDSEALAAFRDAPDIETFFTNIGDEGLMEEWHDGCDCKVVPVFKRESWFGEDAAKQALEVWKSATKEAIRDEDKGIVKRSGPDKGTPLTRNELAINALRRRLESGDVSMTGFSALAA